MALTQTRGQPRTAVIRRLSQGWRIHFHTRMAVCMRHQFLSDCWLEALHSPLWARVHDITTGFCWMSDPIEKAGSCGTFYDHVSKVKHHYFWFIFVLIVQSLSHNWLSDPMNWSTPGFPVLHYLPKFAQTHVRWVSDAIQSVINFLWKSWEKSLSEKHV